MPAFASANSGTITKLVHGCSSSCRRSLGETADSRPSRVARASSGVGCSRNERGAAVAPRGRRAPAGTRVRREAHRQAGDRRVDAGLVHRQPDAEAEHDVGRAAPDAQAPERDEDARTARSRWRARTARHARCRRSRSRAARTRSSTTTSVSRNTRRRSGQRGPDEREHAERERGVGRHRGAPAVRAAPPGVEREVDQRPARPSPPTPANTRQRDAPALAQLAHVELAPRLQADDEEEEHHQPVVDPVAQVFRQRRGRRCGTSSRCSRTTVGVGVDVRPGEADDRRPASSTIAPPVSVRR